eukprot:SAG31_NODE_242_length_19350_cov_3.043998_10_plen_164_part_00
MCWIDCLPLAKPKSPLAPIFVTAAAVEAARPMVRGTLLCSVIQSLTECVAVMCWIHCLPTEKPKSPLRPARSASESNETATMSGNPVGVKASASTGDASSASSAMPTNADAVTESTSDVQRNSPPPLNRSQGKGESSGPMTSATAARPKKRGGCCAGRPSKSK